MEDTRIAKEAPQYKPRGKRDLVCPSEDGHSEKGTEKWHNAPSEGKGDNIKHF
jgi:hypothetical protein